MEPTQYIWKDGELIGWDDATIHVLSHGLHYGTGAFEGIRVYETDRGPAVFRPTEHMERLARSCRALSIPVDWTADELANAAKELFAANAYLTSNPVLKATIRAQDVFKDLIIILIVAGTILQMLGIPIVHDFFIN